MVYRYRYCDFVLYLSKCHLAFAWLLSRMKTLAEYVEVAK